MKKFWVICILALSGLLGFLLSFYLHQEKPAATTQEIQTFHYPVTFVKHLAGDPRAGEKIFKEFCAACHAANPKIDVNAPKIGDEKVWRDRRKLGMPLLLKITIQGAGAMPARGGCFECSDEQLLEAIHFLVIPEERF